MTNVHEISTEEAMAFFDGELAGPRAAEVKAHIARCAQCQAIGGDAAAVSEALAAWRVEPASATLVAPAERRGRRWTSPIAKVALLAAACAAMILGTRTLRCEVLACTRETTRPVPSAPLPQGAAFTETWLKQPRVDLHVQAGDARVVVVAFIDWLCNACRGYELAYQPVFARYAQSMPGAVQLQTRDWPWNAACNPGVARTFPGHEGSCTAALAVRLARARGKAEEMIAWLFDNLDRLTQLPPEAAIAEIKREARRRLGIDDFDAAAAAVRPAFEREIAGSVSLDITATPTFFINGVRVPSDQQLPPQYFDAAIAAELARK